MDALVDSCADGSIDAGDSRDEGSGSDAPSGEAASGGELTFEEYFRLRRDGVRRAAGHGHPGHRDRSHPVRHGSALDGRVERRRTTPYRAGLGQPAIALAAKL